MLPELRTIEARVSSETNKRLVRVRGLARLSAWFAFGYVFCDVVRYTIEVDQHGDLWQTDAKPSADFTLSSNGPEGEVLDAEGDAVAIGISVSAIWKAISAETFSTGQSGSGPCCLCDQIETWIDTACVMPATQCAARGRCKNVDPRLRQASRSQADTPLLLRPAKRRALSATG